MERSVKIFIGVTIGVLILIGLGFYSSWFKSQKAVENLTFINETDPLLVNAKQKGAATLPTLYALFDSMPQACYVRFPYKAEGLEVHLWAPVKELKKDYAEVEIAPGPGVPSVITEKQTRQIATGQIEDWLVEMPDGTIQGGYTTQALLRAQLNKTGAPKDSILRQLQSFLHPL